MESVVEMEVEQHGLDAPHGSDDDDDDDDDDDLRSCSSSSAASSVSMYQGDSVCSSEDISTAVAVEPDDGDAPPKGEGAPTKRRDTKPPPPPRPPRDTTPVDPQSRVEGSARPKRLSNFTPKESNVGWFFANWGHIPKSGAKRDHIDSVLKKQPATIIGLTECDAITDAYLRRAGWKGGPQLREADDPPSRVDDTMKERDAYQSLTSEVVRNTRC